MLGRLPIASLLIALSLSGAPPASTGDSEAIASSKIQEILTAYFEQLLSRDAVLASEIGDPRYNDRLENFLSEEYREAEREFRQRWLGALQAVDRSALEGQDRLSYDVFVWEQKRALRELDFPRHLLPVSQLFSVPSLFAQLGSGEGDHSFRTEKDYRDFLARIDAWMPVADQIIANLQEGIDTGVVQPKVLMERALPQLEAHVVSDPTDSVFYRPIAAMPETIDPEEAATLELAYKEAIRDQIVPSYRRIHDFVRDVYLPACRETVGLSALPRGEAWYAHFVRVHTTTDLTPDEVHALGLAEVERIAAAMRDIQRRVGFEGELADFLAELRENDRFYVDAGTELLAAYEALRQRVAAALPRLFDISTDAPFVIQPVPEYYASSAPAAIYNPGSPDGSRPGTFYVNTHDLRARPLYQTEALFLHEALPGHHFQSAIARGAGELPMFRRFILANAYVEGWGLYSESLGGELGLYTDPYMAFGRLDNEMLRAARLVVDTGIHAQDWTREEAIEYLRSNTSLGETDIVSEVERYISWPGQALSYKIGEIFLQRLRQEASRRLGSSFNVAAFHREILEDGVLPLTVLEAKIVEWIESIVPEQGLRSPSTG